MGGGGGVKGTLQNCVVQLLAVLNQMLLLALRVNKFWYVYAKNLILQLICPQVSQCDGIGPKKNALSGAGGHLQKIQQDFVILLDAFNTKCS